MNALLSISTSLRSLSIAAVLLTCPTTVTAQRETTMKLVPSARFAPSGRIVQDLVRKGDFIGARNKLADLPGDAETPADRHLLGNFQLEIGRYFNDEGLQRKGLATLLDTGLAPPADAARYHDYAGSLALNARDFVSARLHLMAAADIAPANTRTLLHLAEAYFGEAGEHREGVGFDAAGKALVRQGLPHLRRAIAMEMTAGKSPDPSWAWRGADLAHLSGDPDAESWQRLAGQFPRKSAAAM
jgi:hypothetical protein